MEYILSEKTIKLDSTESLNEAMELIIKYCNNLTQFGSNFIQICGKRHSNEIL